MTTIMPEDYDSDDLDRLVAEADRKAAKLRHLDEELSVSAQDDDDGYRYNPVTGESRLYKER